MSESSQRPFTRPKRAVYDHRLIIGGAADVGRNQGMLDAPRREMFISRRRELSVLCRALEAAQRRHGQIVLVSGEAGIGKTRLAQELAAVAASGTVSVLWGRCAQGDTSPPYWPWAQIVGSFAERCSVATLRRLLGPAVSRLSFIVIPNAVAAVAYGVYVSPEYRVPGECIPAVATLRKSPPVQGYNELSFTLFLPSGARPGSGWPVAIVGTGGDQHFATGAVAGMLAAHGIATIGINVAGNGFGPLGTLAIQLIDSSSLVIPDAGRGIDQDGDNLIGLTEGASAAAPRAWTIGVRDSNRQNAIDLLQLVRVIEVGMDVNGDGNPDLDPNCIFFFGNSAGAMYGAIFLALEPGIYAAVTAVPGGLFPEHGRSAPGRRANFFGPQLRDRIPSLLNAPGITTIDGVPINPPHFNENKPLRDQPPVTNTVEGAMAIQHAMELHEWGQQSGQ